MCFICIISYPPEFSFRSRLQKREWGIDFPEADAYNKSIVNIPNKYEYGIKEQNHETKLLAGICRRRDHPLLWLTHAVFPLVISLYNRLL